VLYPSSDYVFDGTRRAYIESDLLLPAYGRTKNVGDLGRGRQPASLHRSLLVAFRPRGEEFRRDDASIGDEQPEVLVVPIRSVARPTRHLGEACALLVEGEEYGSTIAAEAAPGTSSPRRSSIRPASSAG
jgi:hypothetical protein